MKQDTRDSNLKTEQNGLTEEENDVSNTLIKAWHLFVQLEQDHPDEMNDFRRSFHRLQSILAMRVVRRDHPEGWYSEIANRRVIE